MVVNTGRDRAFWAAGSTWHRLQELSEHGFSIGANAKIKNLSNNYQHGGDKMKLSAPKQITWWVAVVIGALGVLGQLVTIPVVSGLSFWFVTVGLVILILATLLKDL